MRVRVGVRVGVRFRVTWVCMRGEMPAVRMVAKSRSVRSGTAEVPVPSTVRRATLLIEVMPLMGEPGEGWSGGVGVGVGVRVGVRV